MKVDKNWQIPVSPLMVAKHSAGEGSNLDIFLTTDDIVSAAEAMYKKAYHLENIDVLDVAEGFLVTYHYAHFTEPGRMVHRVLVSREEAEVPTISGVFQGADWHERECNDFHGVKFSGHPNLIPLLLDPDIPNGVLLKTDKSRKPLRDVLNPGEVIFKEEGFTLFDDEQPEESEA